MIVDRYLVGWFVLVHFVGDLYHHRPPSEARILSTLHHGPHSLDSQNITSRYIPFSLLWCSRCVDLHVNEEAEF